MFKPDTSKSRQAIVTTALNEVGAKIREVGGKNRGDRVEQYQKIVHIPPGAPWCAAFVSWTTTQGLRMQKIPKWAGGAAVGLFHNAAAALNKQGMTEYYATPQESQKVKPGWVFSQARDAESAVAARKGGYTLGHTGIVVGLDPKDPDVFITAEGNTNDAGAREGDGVYQKTRRFSDPKMVGFFDPVAATIATFKPEEIAALEAGKPVSTAGIDLGSSGGGGIPRLLAAAAGIYLMTKV